MPRILHGQVIPVNTVEVAADILGGPESTIAQEVETALKDDLRAFGFLFPGLQNDPNNLLPETPDTRDHLVFLGQTMRDPGPGDETDPGNSTIPAIYTYFGQFVDHDVTLEAASAPLPNLLAQNVTPLAMSVITGTLKNLRTASLDLDSVYGKPAPRDPANQDKMQLGTVTPLNGGVVPVLRPPGKDDFNDLPREAPSPDPTHDRAALIGDPRNDENLIVAQLHLAFLRAHNAIVDEGNGFVKARRMLRQHYQHIVIHDFLKRVCDPAIVDGILQNGNQVYDPPQGAFFLPLEYAVAAYRFGHTMVRDEYDFNLNFNTSGPPAAPASLALLFTFTALSGEVGFGFPTLPDNWIVQWENLVDGGAPAGMARRIDTMLAEPGLFQLRNLIGQIEPGLASRLATRNLLRGYLLRMPTGQAVAGALGITPLTPAELSAAAGSVDQVEVLDHAGYLDRTPLWYYLLAEAAHGGGNHLGPVGSTIVAEVLIGLVRRSKDSILTAANWTPTLPAAQAGTFTLADLLRLAGVLESGANEILYTVVAGDTLGSIAQQFYGDSSQWTRIFNANQDQISDPDLIFPGQVLRIPQ
jgi:hypothetical protein